MYEKLIDEAMEAKENVCSYSKFRVGSSLVRQEL